MLGACAILYQKGINNTEITEEVTPMSVHIVSNNYEARTGKPADSAVTIGKKVQDTESKTTGKRGRPESQQDKQHHSNRGWRTYRWCNIHRKNGGLPWVEVWKYAKEMAGPVEDNSIGEDI